MPGQPPTYVLVANDASPVAGAPDIKSDEATKVQIAKLQAQLEEKTQEAKTAMEEKEKMEAILKAANVFNQGNGQNNVNTIANTQDEPATKVQEAKIAKLTALVVKPIINQILTAKRNLGASESEIRDDETRLTAMSFEAIEKEYSTNKTFINSALNASVDTEALYAKRAENGFDFNGISSQPLTGKTFSMDQVISEAAN